MYRSFPKRPVDLFNTILQILYFPIYQQNIFNCEIYHYTSLPLQRPKGYVLILLNFQMATDAIHSHEGWAPCLHVINLKIAGFVIQESIQTKIWLQ